MTTIASPQRVYRADNSNVPRLNFAGILRSEWIKLRSVRSTAWVFASTIVASVGLGLLFAATVSGMGGEEMGVEGGSIDAVLASTLGLTLGQLSIAVLGVLIISGEYSTGLIKASLVAVPRRLPLLAAKAIVLAAVTLVLGLAITFGSFFATAPLLANAGAATSITDEGVIPALVAGAFSLVFIALISLGIGTMVRSSAAGISISLGLYMLLPIIVSFIPAEWATEAARYLPTNVTNSLYEFPGATNSFDPWQAWLIMLAWTAVSLGGGAVALARRDV